MAAACSRATGDPPDDRVLSLADPYAKAPAKGAPAIDRAAAVVDAVCDDLGWDRTASTILRRRATEAWMQRVVLFLDHGGDEQIHAAWLDLKGSVTAAIGLDPEVKAEVRRGEARMYDLERAGLSPERRRRAALAEIVWTLRVLARSAAPAERPAAPGDSVREGPAVH